MQSYEERDMPGTGMEHEVNVNRDCITEILNILIDPSRGTGKLADILKRTNYGGGDSSPASIAALKERLKKLND